MVEQEKQEKNEKWVGQTRIRLVEGKLIQVDVHGGGDERRAMAIRDRVVELLEGVSVPVDVMVCLDRASKSNYKARRIWREMAHDPKFRKIAMVGAHPVARVLASFAMDLAGTTRMRFFATEQAAAEWIHG